jgi:hypothetical protein
MVARKFQDWDVGILERFDARDVGNLDEGVVQTADEEKKKVVSQEEFEKMVKVIPGSEGLI